MLHASFDVLGRWHVGTGLGTAQGTDARLYRSGVSTSNGDDNGSLPAQPGSQLKGIVKDSARLVLHIYGRPPELLGAFDAVFGVPGRDDYNRQGWGFQAARPDADDDVEVVVSTHNRVDRVTGTVPLEALHDRELARATTLRTVVEPRYAFDPLERGLLSAALLAVEAIGARRSRGLGRVRTSIHWRSDAEEIDQAQLLQPLRDLHRHEGDPR